MVDETKLQSASRIILKSEEIPNISVQARIAKIGDEAAREMARQISTQAFATITEIVDKVGNVVDGGGKPLSPESFLELLSKMQLEFDENGNPKGLTVVIPPSMEERAKETMEMYHQDPELSGRWQELMDKKRKEWRDREAARKLVG